MQAKIRKETDGAFGIEVVDNNSVVHRIAVSYSGEIEAHQCETYHNDPGKRTPAENEYSEQARKFVQYYVYIKEGCDTVRPEIHPERLNAVRVALASLETDRFEALFGDLYRQLRNHEGRSERVIGIPSDAADEDSALYRQHVYLGLDPRQTDLREETEEIAAQYELDLSTAQLTDSDPAQNVLEEWRSFGNDLGELAIESNTDLSDGIAIETVSDVYAAYVDSDGHEHIGDPTRDPSDRDRDALLELPSMDPGSLENFQDYLNHNLACQIRDCFVRMGLEPPEPFQILGYGRFEAAEQYRRLDMYPNYIDPEEEKAFA